MLVKEAALRASYQLAATKTSGRDETLTEEIHSGAAGPSTSASASASASASGALASTDTGRSVASTNSTIFPTPINSDLSGTDSASVNDNGERLAGSSATLMGTWWKRVATNTNANADYSNSSDSPLRAARDQTRPGTMSNEDNWVKAAR